MDTTDVESPDVTTLNASEIVIQPANHRRTPTDELQGLARRIRRKSGNMTIRFAYNDPKQGKYGVTFAEIISIWLPRMTDAIEAALVIEVSKEAVKWARKRMRRGSKSLKIVYINASNGIVIREIRLKEKDQDPEIIIPDGLNISVRNRPPLRETASVGYRYILIMMRIFITKVTLAVLRSPKSLAKAIREHKRIKVKRCGMQFREEAAKTMETQRMLKEHALTKVCRTYDQSGKRLKRNATYGNVNDSVCFEIAFENENGSASELVHLFCARKGGASDETRRYAEALAEFHDKLKDYRRLTNRGGIAVNVLIVPRKDPWMHPHIDLSLFHYYEGFGIHGWLFSYQELGYGKEQTPKGTNRTNSICE